MKARMSYAVLMAIGVSACAPLGLGGADESGSSASAPPLSRSSGNAFSSYGNLIALRSAEPQGSAFQKRLAQEYLLFAEEESGIFRDFIDADYFARKGLRAGRGSPELPEEPRTWPRTAAAIGPLSDGRAALMTALDGGGRDRTPVEAARAQRLYDCWVEQESEGFQPDDIADCQQRFGDALTSLQAALADDGDGGQEPMATDAVPPFTYLAYFDFDESELTEQGRLAIDLAATDYTDSSEARITVIGHTDRAGPETYNTGLSQRRALTVQRALVERGVPAGDIAVSWRGETEPAVPTADGVAERRNRRVQILLDGMRRPQPESEPGPMSEPGPLSEPGPMSEPAPTTQPAPNALSELSSE